MMGPMLQVVLGVPAIAGMLWIFVSGLSAPRTRKLAIFGMIPAGCAFGALLWSALNPEVELVARFAASLAAIAGGSAHAVWVSTLALPRQKVWLRLLFVPMGLWAGATLSLWFVLPESGVILEACLLLLLAATLCSWFLLPWYSRRPEFIQLGARKLACVRFACPRCGDDGRSRYPQVPSGSHPPSAGSACAPRPLAMETRRGPTVARGLRR